MVGVTEGCEVESGAGEEAVEEAGPVPGVRCRTFVPDEQAIIGKTMILLMHRPCSDLRISYGADGL